MSSEVCGGLKTPEERSVDTTHAETLTDLIDRVERESFMRALERRRSRTGDESAESQR
jgi:hypothetical protein